MLKIHIGSSFIKACMEKRLIWLDWDGMYRAISEHGYYLGFFPAYHSDDTVDVRIVWGTQIVSAEDFIDRCGKLYPEIVRQVIFHLDEFVQTK